MIVRKIEIANLRLLLIRINKKILCVSNNSMIGKKINSNENR
ncbi:hypothetical protein [Enterococcus mundtii]|nr:hypothetical protein [Enterococcus mundtii]